jgi:hypothetical protein
MRSAAAELAAGILLGLHNCRHGNSETLLEYCPDYAAERASGVVSDCAGSASSYQLPAGLRPGICSRAAAAAYHARGCQCCPAGLCGGR